MKARDKKSNDSHFHRTQRAVDTDELRPTANQEYQEILDQELKMNHTQRTQDLERQLSLQHLLHQLVQGQGAYGGVDLQQHETRDTTPMVFHKLEQKPPSEFNYVFDHQQTERTLGILITAKIDPAESIIVEESCGAESSGDLTPRSQMSCSHSLLGLSSQLLRLEDSGKTSTTHVASITDTCSNSHDDPTDSESIEHLNGMYELKETSCLCVVPTTQDASDMEIQDVQQVEDPTPSRITDEIGASTPPLEVFEPFDQDHLNEPHVSSENRDTKSNYFQPGDPVELQRESKWYIGVVHSVHDSKETLKSKSYSILWWMSDNSQRRATKVLPDLRSPVPRDLWSCFGRCIDVVFGVVRAAIEWASFPFTTTTTPYFDQTICLRHIRKFMSSNNSTPTCVVEETLQVQVRCALLIDEQTAPKTSMVHLNPPKNQTKTVMNYVLSACKQCFDLCICSVLRNHPHDDLLSCRMKEKMTMAHETVVRCEQILPPARVSECQDVKQSRLARASDFSIFPLDPETKTTTDSDLYDCTTSETTSITDTYSNSSDDDLAMRPCLPVPAIPMPAKMDLANVMLTIDDMEHGWSKDTPQGNHIDTMRPAEAIESIQQDKLVDNESSLQSTQNRHTTAIMDSTISSVVHTPLPQHHRHARQARGSRIPPLKEDMKTRRRRVCKKLPQVTEKKRQEEQMRERKEILEQMILFEQARQEKRRRQIQLMTHKIHALLEEKQQ
ncbi:hypothetical protein Ae201684P_001417 [Aphanomyces euteiches]|nr:hypothetical protein Ae201684P_001417 [Aphanomyces euteiches]